MPNGKPFPKPTFMELHRNYPTDGSAFGRGGTIVDNVAYRHICALRLSVALTRFSKDFMNDFGGNMAVDQAADVTLPYARGSKALADYLSGNYIMWSSLRIGSYRDAMRLRQQGIIFWKNTATVDHIDLFDGALRQLPSGRHRSMLWIPQRDQFCYALFWRL